MGGMRRRDDPARGTPKSSGMVLSRTALGRQEPGFRQRLTPGEAQGRVRRREFNPVPP